MYKKYVNLFSCSQRNIKFLFLQKTCKFEIINHNQIKLCPIIGTPGMVVQN